MANGKDVNNKNDGMNSNNRGTNEGRTRTSNTNEATDTSVGKGKTPVQSIDLSNPAEEPMKPTTPSQPAGSKPVEKTSTPNQPTQPVTGTENTNTSEMYHYGVTDTSLPENPTQTLQQSAIVVCVCKCLVFS